MGESSKILVIALLLLLGMVTVKKVVNMAVIIA